MNIRILTEPDYIDEVIEEVKNITIVDGILIVRANMTYTYRMDTILFFQMF